jgi:hypothetical protein
LGDKVNGNAEMLSHLVEEIKTLQRPGVIFWRSQSQILGPRYGGGAESPSGHEAVHVIALAMVNEMKDRTETDGEKSSVCRWINETSGICLADRFCDV